MPRSSAAYRPPSAEGGSRDVLRPMPDRALYWPTSRLVLTATNRAVELAGWVPRQVRSSTRVTPGAPTPSPRPGCPGRPRSIADGAVGCTARSGPSLADVGPAQWRCAAGDAGDFSRGRSCRGGTRPAFQKAITTELAVGAQARILSARPHEQQVRGAVRRQQLRLQPAHRGGGRGSRVEEEVIGQRSADRRPPVR